MTERILVRWRDVRDARLRLEQPARADIEPLLVHGHVHDAQAHRAQTVLHRLIPRHLRPGAVARIGEHFAGKLDSLLRARHDDDLIGRATRRAHRGRVLRDCLTQRRQTIACTVAPVVVAGTAGFAAQQAIPDLARKQIARRQRRLEWRSRLGLVVARITSQRLCAFRQTQRRAAGLASSLSAPERAAAHRALGVAARHTCRRRDGERCSRPRRAARAPSRQCCARRRDPWPASGSTATARWEPALRSRSPRGGDRRCACTQAGPARLPDRSRRRRIRSVHAWSSPPYVSASRAPPRQVFTTRAGTPSSSSLPRSCRRRARTPAPNARWSA